MFFCFFRNFKLKKVYVLGARYVWKTAKAAPPSIIWAESFSLLTKYLFEPWRQKGSFVPSAGKNSLISPPGLLPNSPHWGIPSIWTTDLVDRMSGERSNVCASVIWVIISYELHKTEQELFSLIICPICNNVLWICSFIKITIFNCSAPPPSDISHNKGRRACLSLLRRLNLAKANANEKPMKRKPYLQAGISYLHRLSQYEEWCNHCNL